MARTLLCIVGLWGFTGGAFALGVGSTVVSVLVILYVISASIMYLRYKTSTFGRTWIPRLLCQYFEWPPLIVLQGVAPPLGAFVANAAAIALAAHIPLLLLCFGVPAAAIEALSDRAASRP